MRQPPTGVPQNNIMGQVCNVLKARHLDYIWGDWTKSCGMTEMQAADQSVGQGQEGVDNKRVRARGTTGPIFFRLGRGRGVRPPRAEPPCLAKPKTPLDLRVPPLRVRSGGVMWVRGGRARGDPAIKFLG